MKPPLGIIPFRVHNEIRLSNINDAIKRWEDFTGKKAERVERVEG